MTPRACGVRNGVFVVPETAKLDAAYEPTSVIVWIEPPGEIDRALVREPAIDKASKNENTMQLFNCIALKKIVQTVWASHGISGSAATTKTVPSVSDGSRLSS